MVYNNTWNENLLCLLISNGYIMVCWIWLMDYLDGVQLTKLMNCFGNFGCLDNKMWWFFWCIYWKWSFFFLSFKFGLWDNQIGIQVSLFGNFGCQLLKNAAVIGLYLWHVHSMTFIVFDMFIVMKDIEPKVAVFVVYLLIIGNWHCINCLIRLMTDRSLY